jgi:hypothetical protein
MSLPSGFAMRVWCPHRAGGNDCLQVGPGLPRSVALPADVRSLGPFHSSPPQAVFQISFSMTQGDVIGKTSRPLLLRQRRRHRKVPVPSPSARHRRRFLTIAHDWLRVPTSGCRAENVIYSAPETLAARRLSGPADSRPRAIPTELAAGSALNCWVLYAPNRIRRHQMKLDRVLGRCLESAPLTGRNPQRPGTRCRPRRIGPCQPLAMNRVAPV